MAVRMLMEDSMSSLSNYAFVASLATLVFAFALQALSMVPAQQRLHLAFVGHPHGARSHHNEQIAHYAGLLAVNGFLFLTTALVARAVATGHGPFASMFEFSLAFSWGVLALHLYFRVRYPVPSLGLVTLPVAIGLLAYASTVSNQAEPLVPALQNQLLLTVHVAVAIIAYGAFSVAFAAAVLFLVQRNDSIRWLPSRAVLDEVGYRSVVVGFPLLALTILLGAIWAERAWGSYWTWDPKETSSLATWLIYGGYLHARVVRDWKGHRSAYLLIGGFAATLLTYYGNLFFGGMHKDYHQASDSPDKIDADEKGKIEAAIKEAEEAIKGSDKAAMEAKTQALAMASQKLGEKVYAQQQAAGGAEAGAGAGGGHAGGEAKKDEGDVVDAEFTEVKDKKG